MTNITAHQAVRNAVEAELAAARFYRLLADSTDDRAAKGFLAELSEQEVGHATAIEQASKDIVDGPLPARAHGPVEGIETVPSWKYADDLNLGDALEVALAAENQAALYYDAFADYLEEPAAGFFRDLARTEENHAREIARRRDQLAGRKG